MGGLTVAGLRGGENGEGGDVTWVDRDLGRGPWWRGGGVVKAGVAVGRCR